MTSHTISYFVSGYQSHARVSFRIKIENTFEEIAPDLNRTRWPAALTAILRVLESSGR